MNLRRTALCTCSLACLLLTSRHAAADGVVRDSIGAPSSGRGGANIAHFDNGAVMLSNPAAIVNTPTPGLFEFGVDGMLADVDYSDPENIDHHMHNNPVFLPEASFIRHSADGRFAWGIGFFAPAGFSASWNLTNPLLGKHGYKSFAAVGKILPTLAMRVTDRLSVGASLGVAVSHAELESPFFIQTGPLAGAPTLMDIQGSGADLAWSVGLQYRLSDRTMIGASYVSESRFRLKGRASVDAFLEPGAPPFSSRFDVQTDMAWPRHVGVGILHDLDEKQRLSLDVLWYNWSQSFDNVGITFRNPSNPLFLAFGSKIRDSFALNWKDSVSVRLGYEYFVTPANVMRFGYVHNSRTVPDGTLTPLIPALLEHTFTVGYGHFVNNTRFDVAYQYAFGPTAHVRQSELVGGEFSFSTVNAQTHWLMFSFTQFF